MSQPHKTVRLCSCNGSLTLEARSLGDALQLGEPVYVSHALCRQDHPQFTAALQGGEDMIVACTQEAPLFRELAEQSNYAGKLSFINVRELAGWSAEAKRAKPKVAALLALAALPDPEPVPAVSFSSHGATLIIGPLDAVVSWAEQLKDQLEVSVLATSTATGELPSRREYPIYSGQSIKINGFLGAFNVTWEHSNPIDLERCTRCNACIRVCPEQAIGFAYQIDLDKCQNHRACVVACGEIGAIDFDRDTKSRGDRYDLIFDLSAEPLIRLPHPPQGYFAPGRDPLAQAQAARELVKLVGEFEKPKYFNYRANICAHSRNQITGCSKCLDVCSTGAISSDGDHVKVDPHLCMGCGGCATVCPSGAMRYAYPRVADMGVRLKTVLGTYRSAGGHDGCLLLYRERGGEDLLMQLGRHALTKGRGLPARVIPLPVHDIASVGLDILLGAIACGASQCVILYQGDEPEAYMDATRRQMEIGDVVLNTLGFSGKHFQLIEAFEASDLEDALWLLEPAATVERPAAFNLSDEKRSTLEFVFEHLAKQAPARPDVIPLPASAAYGTVNLDKAKCTLCMSCVGACPASALMDSPDFPRLKFVERNCVQCGLCVKTCPENALSLTPRLLLTPEVRAERVLNEAEPFHCVRCGKPFGTRQMIDNMLGKLSGHSMFAGGDALRRLQMCADCRVIDMMENKNETTIFDL